MEVKLIVARGPHAGEELPVKGPKYFIGRAEDCQLRPRTDLVSRHHCALVFEEDRISIRDFGSKNGTYVNDERVFGELQLRTGDLLKVGNLEFEVRITLLSAKKPSAPPANVAPAEQAAPAEKSPDADVANWLEEDLDTPLGSETTGSISLRDTVTKSRPAASSGSGGSSGGSTGSGTGSGVSKQTQDTVQGANKDTSEEKKAAGPPPLPKRVTRKKPNDSTEAASKMLDQFFRHQ